MTLRDGAARHSLLNITHLNHEVAMDDPRDANPLNAPEFIREREAWYKAGAGKMASFMCVAVLVVGVFVGLASLIFGLGPYEAAAAIIAGTWCSGAAINFYIDVSARQAAYRGGVQIDRF